MIPTTTRLLRLAHSPLVRPSSRLISRTVSTAHGKDSHLSQGNVSKAKHHHPGDVHDQAARAGQESADKSPYDAASGHKGKQAQRRGLSGNPEGVGFAEQVGSASASEEKHPEEGKGATEDSTPPGVVGALKSKLGLGTSTEEVKQNRGGGGGVTGTGSFGKQDGGRRQMHVSAVAWADQTKGQAPAASREPKDCTYSEQNEHLHHRRDTESASEGKGNAAQQPSLPSHKFDDKAKKENTQQRRAFHSSARRLETKHTADSYFKDVDDTPPQSSKTHQVDPSGTGAQVTRPNEPHTGEFADTGAQSKEYDTTSTEKPYDTPPTQGEGREEKLRYGGTGGSGSHAGGQSPSKPGEGPEGASAGGHHPEGRSKNNS